MIVLEFEHWLLIRTDVGMRGNGFSLLTIYAYSYWSLRICLSAKGSIEVGGPSLGWVSISNQARVCTN